MNSNANFGRGIAVAATFFATQAWAAIIIDGVRDVDYGPALSIQTVNTGFGDNFSELDAGYGRIEDGNLILLITGNIEANFNKLEIFIDSNAGGQSIFDSSGNDGAGVMDGLVFDPGFTADYHLIARRGNAGNGNRFDLDFADLVAQSATAYGDVFAGFDQGIATTGTGVNAVPITLAYHGSNTGGVTGAAPGAANQEDAAAVVTGLELSIDLADLGYTAGPIKILVGINGSSHNFWSNQFLGGLPAPQGNLGGDEAGGFTGEGAIDLTHFAGDQYFTVVPEPSAVVFAGVALAGWLGGRRRRS